MSEVAPFLTILTIATRNYARYAIDLIRSIDRFVEQPTQILCFTDDERKFDGLNVANHELELIRIPSFGWPNATLLRFHIFFEHRLRIKGDVLIYLDADTLVVDHLPLTPELVDEWESGIALVEHPGYYRASLAVRLFEKYGNGTWESRKESCAFVPRHDRRRYVCGGVWMGKTRDLLEMISDARDLVERDKIAGIRAIHNDESYLNRWALNRKVTRLEPSWAFADGYKNLCGLHPIIKVVNKPNDWVRDQGEADSEC